MNGLGLLAVSQHPRFSSHRFSGYAILGGSAVFSGSIMALVLFKKYACHQGGADPLISLHRLSFLGPITPLGGMVMIAG